MRKLLLLVILISITHFQSNAQNSGSLDSTNKKAESQKQDDKIITKIEVEPEVDKETWSKFLNKHINYDIATFNDAPRGIYNVKVKFTVFADGHVGDVIALTKYGYGMEQEVVKALKKSPNWKPASQNGKFVTATRIQNVKFIVETL